MGVYILHNQIDFNKLLKELKKDQLFARFTLGNLFSYLLSKIVNPYIKCDQYLNLLEAPLVEKNEAAYFLKSQKLKKI